MWRLLAVFLLVCVRTHAAGDSALDRATLRGIKTVGVVVDRIDPELGKEGFDAETFQTRVEMRLRNAGIEVVPNAPEFLALRLLHVRGGRGPFAVCLAVGLYQPVTLVRDAKVRTATQTWEAETVLMAPPKMVYSASLDSLDELVDRFIEAWRSVNSK
jgi:hypothetical protein